MKYVYVTANVVTDVARVDPFSIFSEAYAAQFIEAPDEVEGGWLYDGETFTAAPPVDPVPHSCTRRQGLLALLAYGHRRADIEALIAAIPDEMEREAALIEYEAATWESGNQFLQQIWAQLGGTPEQLDDLFRMAVAL